jgi:hypothetical protein
VPPLGGIGSGRRGRQRGGVATMGGSIHDDDDLSQRF